MTEDMTERARNFWVGMFVLAAAAVLGTLMVWFGEVPDWMATGEWTLRITGVQELRGIGEGSPVKLSGVEIGRVKDLDFVNPSRPDQGVVVIARIKQRYTVPIDAKAYVYGATLGFGSGHVDITVEPAREHVPLPKKDAEIRGEMRSRIGELVSQDMIESLQNMVTHIGDLAAAAVPVANNVAKLIEQRSIEDIVSQGAAQGDRVPNLSSVLQRIDTFMAHLNTVLGDEGVAEDVKMALRDLKDITHAMKNTLTLWESETQELSDNLNTGIDHTKKNLDDSFVKLNRVLEQLDDASSIIAATLQNISEGEGTAGKLVGDDRLYEAAVIAMERFSEVMANLQAITGKIKEDGYIIVGQAPSGLLKKRSELPIQATDLSR